MNRRATITTLNALLRFKQAVSYYGTPAPLSRARHLFWRYVIARPIERMAHVWIMREYRAGRLRIAPTTGMFDRRRNT